MFVYNDDIYTLTQENQQIFALVKDLWHCLILLLFVNGFIHGSLIVLDTTKVSKSDAYAVMGSIQVAVWV